MKIILPLALLILSLPSWGMKISDERGSVFLDVPSDWKYEKNLLGIPHVFLSPDSTNRTSLSLTLTGIEDVKLPVNELKKNQEQYQKGRREWALERDFTILSFIPYETSKTKDKFAIHSIGFEYKDSQTTYFEQSYYVECPGSLVHLKILGPKNSVRMPEARKMIHSLVCRS